MFTHSLERPIFSSFRKVALLVQSRLSLSHPFLLASSFVRFSQVHSLSSYIRIIPLSIRQTEMVGRVLSLNENFTIFQGEHSTFNKNVEFPNESIILFLDKNVVCFLKKSS